MMTLFDWGIVAALLLLFAWLAVHEYAITNMINDSRKTDEDKDRR